MNPGVSYVTVTILHEMKLNSPKRNRAGGEEEVKREEKTSAITISVQSYLLNMPQVTQESRVTTVLMRQHITSSLEHLSHSYLHSVYFFMINKFVQVR